MSRAKRAFKAAFGVKQKRTDSHLGRDYGQRMRLRDGSVYTPLYSRSRTYGHHTINGERECLRRVRQIRSGQLKAENGLVVHG